jgi:hypothetical protein
MKNVFATAISVAAASLGPAFVFALALPVFDKFLTPKNLAFYFLCAVAVSAAHAIVFGLPVCFALQKTGRFSLSSVVLSGLAIGTLPTATLFVIQAASESSQVQLLPSLVTISFVGFLGAVGSACFYSARVGCVSRTDSAKTMKECGDA